MVSDILMKDKTRCLGTDPASSLKNGVLAGKGGENPLLPPCAGEENMIYYAPFFSRVGGDEANDSGSPIPDKAD